MEPVPNTNSTSEPNQLNKEAPKQGTPVTPANSQSSLHNTEPENMLSQKPVHPIIRTFESDAAMVLQKKKASVVNIAIAESKKQHNTESIGTRAVKETVSSVTKLLLALIFIAGGGAVFYYLYTQGLFSQSAPIVQAPVIPSIIKADSQMEINISKQADVAQAVVNARTASSLPVGSITHVYFTQNVGEQTEFIDTRGFFLIINSHAPDSLIRSLRPEFMFGFHESLANEPFLILKTDSFQNTFAGMLAWEEVMLDDVDGLFTPINTNLNESIEVIPGIPSSAETGTSTDATSTELVVQEYTTKDFLDPKAFFEDLVIRNKDVRVLQSTANQTLLLYTFTDPQTLVITSSESTLREVLDRIETKVYVE